ncbi:MAG: hypothetical protein ABIN48_12975 [Ginsengibacter sp.]
MSSIYNPFERFAFPENECFLSGQAVETSDKISVFPEWIMQRYSLHDKNMTMLAENIVKYSDIKVPCAPQVKEKIDFLEKEIQEAFEAGYEAVKTIAEIKLFQWMAKMLYGVLYNDFVHGIRHMKTQDKAFTLSPLLTKKYSNLHLMLQSIIRNIEFVNFTPWSISIVPVNYSKDIFNYKDETKNVNFSLGMNDFGIVACLQDNGENKREQENLLNKIVPKKLHPIQFEELCARFLYSNYLLHNSSDYRFGVTDKTVVIESIPLPEDNKEPLFGKWDDKTFSQVLANFWKPWGFTSNDIYTFPDSPISYLINDYTNEFIDPESITLPR